MEHVANILTFVIKASLHMAPFFFISILLGAAVHSWTGLKTKLNSFLGQHPFKMIIVASLLGTVSPFCSCGVIPIIAGMLSAGTPIAPALAFWISSPLMDPETFTITYAGLGLSMALGRTISAFVLGMAAGAIGLLFSRDSSLKSQILNPEGCGCCNFDADPADKPSKLRVFSAQVVNLTLYLGKWLLIAFFLEALIVNYVPSSVIEELLGSNNAFSIPIAAIIGIPLYINTFSAVPIVSGLLAKGMSSGAALAFLVAGPVTTIPAIVAVTSIAKRKLLITYILICLIGSVLAGYIYQLIAG